MKALLRSYQYSIMLLCTIVAMLSCNYQDKGANPVTHQNLKSFNKDTLLKVVTLLAIAMQKEPHGITSGKKLLKAYALIYKINMGGAYNHRADSAEYLNVFMPEDGMAKPEMVAFRLHPPQSLRSKITFKDLKEHFGNWILSPPMEEDTTSTTLFNPKVAPNVSVGVFSKKRPSESDSSIELITIMR